MPPFGNFRKLHPRPACDSVALVAPAGPFDPAALEKGLALLSERYRVRYDERIHSR